MEHCFKTVQPKKVRQVLEKSTAVLHSSPPQVCQEVRDHDQTD